MQHLIARDNHPRPNIQNYLTFGLAQIYFPRDKVVQIALNRISLKLLKFWIEGAGQSPDTRSILERFVSNWQDTNNPDNLFTAKLEAACLEKNKTFSRAIASWKKRLDNQIAEIKTKDDRIGIKQQLTRQLRQQFRTTQPGEIESTRGIWLTRILQITPGVKQLLQQDLDLYLQELLNPENQDFSLTVARNWLEAIITELDRYLSNLEAIKQSLGGVYSNEDADKQYTQIEQIIDEIEGKSNWFGLDNNNKTKQIKEQAKRAVEKIANYCDRNFQYSLTLAAIGIVKDLQKHLRSLSVELADLNTLIAASLLEYEREENELKQLNFDDEMSGEALLSSPDIEACYQTIIPSKSNRSQLVLLSKKVTETIVGETFLTGFIDRRVDDRELNSTIDEAVDTIFASRSLNRVQSAISRFLENYSSRTERATRLAQIRAESSLLLPIDRYAPYFRNDEGKSFEIVAFKDIDERNVKQFKTSLKDDVGLNETSLKPIQTSDEVIFVSEYAGFPLRLLKSLPDLREQYRSQKKLGSFVHNDYQTFFSDILPPEPQVVHQIEEVFFPVHALHLLPYNEATNQYELPYEDSLRGTTNICYLSEVWDEAMETLIQYQEIFNTLEKLLNDTILKIENNPHSWEDCYLPLIRKFITQVDDLTEEDPNYLYQAAVIGTRGSAYDTGSLGIIERFSQKIFARLSELEDPISNNSQTTAIANQIHRDLTKSIAPEIFPSDDTLSLKLISNTEVNRSKRRAEIKLLKQDLEDDIITTEEYEMQRQQILAKYPI